MAKKLTETERLVDEQMLAMLEWGVRAARQVAQDWEPQGDQEDGRVVGEARRN